MDNKVQTEIKAILESPVAKRFMKPAKTNAASTSVSSSSVTDSLLSSSSSGSAFLSSLMFTSAFSSEDAYDNIKNFTSAAPRILPSTVLDSTFDFADWIARVAMYLSMFPRIATIIFLPVFHASIKMAATDTSSVFGSEIGVLATLDEVMKIMFGYTPIAQLGDDFRLEPFTSYFDLRHRITKLRRKQTYRSFQLPSNYFQIKVREKMAMSV